MTWDLGLQGVGLLLLMSVVSGGLAFLMWVRTAPRWVWPAASALFFVAEVLVSEWWFGWATEEDLQPNIDGVSFDEVLLLGNVVPLVVLAIARLALRRRSGGAVRSGRA